MTNDSTAERAMFSGRHLSEAAVLDVARNVTAVTAEPRLQDHVSSCAACRGKLNRWSGFAALAGREQRVSPPPAAVARALRLMEGRPRVSTLTRIKAALQYDSAWAPVPSGVRGASVPDQVIYEAEGVAVDLRVSYERERNVVIVGQLAHADQPERRLADMPVLLLDGNDVKIRALSNAWGEFHLEHPRRDRLRLEVGLPGGHVIRIPLKSERKPS
jgi:hypothetical protein